MLPFTTWLGGPAETAKGYCAATRRGAAAIFLIGVNAPLALRRGPGPCRSAPAVRSLIAAPTAASPPPSTTTCQVSPEDRLPSAPHPKPCILVSSRSWAAVLSAV
eukprot:scaffold9109_cov48-Phaeocystis_antarctica.AAC.3